MTSNRAAVLHGIHDLRIEDLPLPQPDPHQVLVEISAVGICGSDVHYYEHGRIGDFVVEAPMILGHESGGTVIALGSAVGNLTLGQRVALEPGVPCRRCEQCRAGRYNLCPDVQFFATPPVDGSLAERVVIDADFAFAVPDSLSDAGAALIEPLSVGIWACRKAGVTAGSRVLVTGAGPIGVLAGLVARASGAAHVAVTDINAARLAQALELGLDQAVPAGADLADVGADVLLECTGVEAVAGAGITALRPAGIAVLIGMGANAQMTLPTQAIQNRELTVTGTFRYANTYPAAIALAASGRIDLDALVGARVPLDRTEEALLMGRTDPTVLKTVVEVHS
jgi:L-iditol 2-dehydrogenase